MNKGQYYEDLAAGYLRKAGLSVLERNFCCRAGEIDLICRQGEQLVFVEVRYRSNPDFGSAAASVTRTKQHKIIRAAQLYLQLKPQHSNRSCRFDVVAIAPLQTVDQVDVQWLQNAFIS